MKYRFCYCIVLYCIVLYCIVLYTHTQKISNSCAYAYTFICCSDASFGRRRRGQRRLDVRHRRNLQLEDSFADTSVEGELKDQDYYNAEEN